MKCGEKMPNIMINETCNLRCPYCFASEFVNQSPKEMTMEAFQEALEFVLADGTERQIGIIGGEPALHSKINEILKIAMDDVRSYPVMIYTNAVFLEKISDENLENRKFRMLVNCNSPEDMGKDKYEKMRSNIRKFIEEHIGAGRFKLSINLYKPDFDYSYVLELVKEFRCDNIRLSVSVPSKNSLNGEDALSYFRRMKKCVMDFTADMLRAGVIPGFDCNFIPHCIYTEDEIKGLMGIKTRLRQLLKTSGNILIKAQDFGDSFWERSIISEIQACSPVVDILPDLTAVRCFGLSEYTKKSIRDFKSISELMKYYYDNIDYVSRDAYSSEECKDCFKRRNRKCSGGCYIFKIDKIIKAV